MEKCEWTNAILEVPGHTNNNLFVQPTCQKFSSSVVLLPLSEFVSVIREFAFIYFTEEKHHPETKIKGLDLIKISKIYSIDNWS